MRGRAIVLGIFGMATGLVFASAGLNCGSDSAGAGDDSGAGFDNNSEGSYLCDFFTEVGAPCPQASPIICFQLCTDGGCSCKESPGGPVWACTTDLSCLPDSGPLDDSGDNPLPDGSEGDDGAGLDAGTDSGNDAGLDAPVDAGADAEDDAGDASPSDAATD